MKERMKTYFPERFEDSNTASWTNSSLALIGKAVDISKARCEFYVNQVFGMSDDLRLLAGAMKKHGCNFTLARHVVCERCHGCYGGYDPDTNQIVICKNSVITKNKVLSVMAHEMIHMFDFCRAKFDFNNLDHVACSEIRAANLTYCSISEKISKFGPYPLGGTHGDCVKKVAFASVKAYSPETDDAVIIDIVEKVFPTCYNDLEPFGRRPLTGPGEMRRAYRERYHLGYIY